MNRDRIYSLPQTRVGDFEFDDRVASVFPDMIARSVPGYASILSMIEQLTVRYAQPGTNIYDLGCSLGAATLLMRQQAPADCVIHAVDNSGPMIDRLAGLLRQESDEGCGVDVQLADLRDVTMHSASFIVLNLTLQFLPQQDRGRVLQSAYDSLVPGGALLLSEKICFDEPRQQQLMTELHHDFKLAHGYSALEIAQKRTAIENRLIPEPLETHLHRLKGVGFETVAPWFQCFNFVSILAVRPPLLPSCEASPEESN